MKTLLALAATLLLAVPAFAADEDPADLANRAKFEKDCAAMIAPGGPCAEVPMGGGGRRGCVAQNIDNEKATPECKATIEEWKALKK